MKLKIVLLRFLRNCIVILMGFTGYLDGVLLDHHFYTVNSSDPWWWEIFPSSNIFFNFFLQWLRIFIIQEFCLLGYVNPKIFSIIWGYWERCFPEFCVPMNESLVLVLLLGTFFFLVYFIQLWCDSFYFVLLYFILMYFFYKSMNEWY